MLFNDEDDTWAIRGSNTAPFSELSMFWIKERGYMRDFFIHAEIACISVLSNTNIKRVFKPNMAICTLMPCISCVKSLWSVGIRVIYYIDELERDAKAKVVAAAYGVQLIKLDDEILAFAQSQPPLPVVIYE